MKVVVTAPTWSLNGVNVFSENLVRGLCARGVDARILLTDPFRPDPKPLPIPHDLPMERLPIGMGQGWHKRWRTLIQYLEAHAPCIYLPNHDVRSSCVSAQLPAHIGIVGIVHSDDPFHYEHVQRLGQDWNAIVAVSAWIAKNTRALDPTFAARTSTISYGVPQTNHAPRRQPPSAQPLRIVYAGRLEQTQKRVPDLPRIAEALERRGVPFQMTIVGAGSAEAELRRQIRERGVEHRITLLPTISNNALRAELERHDVFLLVSAYEGMPIGVLEAMSVGCIPVVSDLPSGIPELVEDGANGWRVAVGDVETFATRLAELQGDLDLRTQMSARAYETIKKGYSLDGMVNDYLALLTHVQKQLRDETFVRTPRAIVPPPNLSRKEHLMGRVWSVTGRGRARRLAQGSR